VLAALLGKDLLLLGDDNALTGGNVSHQLKAKALKGHGLRGKDVLLASALLPGAQDQRSNAIGVSKSDHAESGNHRHTGICTLGTAL
jgi:hypothetical protein